MAKTETLFLIKSRQDSWLRGNGLHGILQCLFFKSPLLIDLAEELLAEIKTRKQLPASEWKTLVQKFNVTVSNYESCLQRLKAAGIVRKEKGIYSLSNDFSRFLNAVSEIWMDWRAS
jgi:hypothetical protein